MKFNNLALWLSQRSFDRSKDWKLKVWTDRDIQNKVWRLGKKLWARDFDNLEFHELLVLAKKLF